MQGGVCGSSTARFPPAPGFRELNGWVRIALSMAILVAGRNGRAG